ncbi:MAG TPA: hypothetical protein VFQ53_37690 [Kofleriaceae bacterium]|nr:hypothetical protein [Kofleriaceae bacterium]
MVPDRVDDGLLGQVLTCDHAGVRRPRTSFASPFVITLACGGRPTPPPSPANPPEPPADPAVATIRFDDPGCTRVEPSGQTTDIDCPDDVLPVAADGELVVANDAGRCFRVYERQLGDRSSRSLWDEGRVRCPPAGPNVRLPTPMVVTIGRDRYRLDPESLTCVIEVRGNPPYWKRADCPPQLVPQLVGLTPTAPCSYRGIRVNCGVPWTGPIHARIIGRRPAAGGLEIVLGVGTRQGVAAGMMLELGKVRTTVTSCSERACTAIVPLTPEQLDAIGYTVTLKP